MLTQIYQSEFENTNITKDELQLKYSLDTLPDGHETWAKRVQVQTYTPPKLETDDSMYSQLAQAKLSLVAEVRSRIDNNKSFLEIKDLKDLSAILVNLDDKKATQTAPTVNILVQNLATKFAIEDV